LERWKVFLRFIGLWESPTIELATLTNNITKYDEGGGGRKKGKLGKEEERTNQRASTP